MVFSYADDVTFIVSNRRYTYMVGSTLKEGKTVTSKNKPRKVNGFSVRHQVSQVHTVQNSMSVFFKSLGGEERVCGKVQGGQYH